MLFTCVFVLVLGIRAVSLASGDDGRYFAVSGSDDAVVTKSVAQLKQDLPEAVKPVPGEVGSDRSPPVGSRITTTTTTSHPFSGSESILLEFSAGARGGSSYFELPGPKREALSVTPGEHVSVSAAVRPVSGSFGGTSIRLYARYRTDGGAFVDDRLASGAGSVDRVVSASRGRWYRLYGATTAPRRAASATLLILLGDPAPTGRYSMQIDAPVLVPGSYSAARLDAYANPRAPHSSPWRDAFNKALLISLATLAAVFVGYALALGPWLSARLPRLDLRSPRDGRTIRILVALTAIGLAAFVIEMATYGGYGGYLDSLHDAWRSAAGKWYLHSLATIPTGVAVFLVARRAWAWGAEPWHFWEVALIALGVAIGTGYWLKSTIAIPAAIALLFVYFVRRRAVVGLWVAAGLFAILTPFVYIVRGAGSIGLGDLVSSAYRDEFFANLSSRFFQFESLMFASTAPASDDVWRPLADVATSVVPRVLWDDKPVSASARFTEQYLLPGLANPTDIGVQSLPGEFWTLGGPAGVILGGVIIGVLLRAAHSAISRQDVHPGTILVVCSVVTALLLLNDGEGVAAVSILVAIASFGWIPFVKRAEGPD